MCLYFKPHRYLQLMTVYSVDKESNWSISTVCAAQKARLTHTPPHVLDTV